MKGNQVAKALSRLMSTCTVAGSVMVVLMAGTASAQSQPPPTFLESGSSDVISVQRGQVPTATTPIAPLSPSRALNRSSSTNFSAGTRSVGKAAKQSVGKPAKAVSSTRVQSRSRKAPATPGVAPSIGPMSLGGSSASIGSNSVAAPAPVLDSAIAGRLVTVCLNNSASNSGAKAFDVQRRNVPRFVATSGKTTCAQFEPTRQTIYLWKTDAQGKLALTLSNRLDLRNSEGTQIMLNWQQD